MFSFSPSFELKKKYELEYLAFQLASGQALSFFEKFLSQGVIQGLFVKGAITEIGVGSSSHLRVDLTQGKLTRGLALVTPHRIRVEQKGHDVPIEMAQELLEEQGKLLVRPTHRGQEWELNSGTKRIHLSTSRDDGGVPRFRVSAHWGQDVGAHGAQKHISHNEKTYEPTYARVIAI